MDFAILVFALSGLMFLFSAIEGTSLSDFAKSMIGG